MSILHPPPTTHYPPVDFPPCGNKHRVWTHFDGQRKIPFRQWAVGGGEWTKYGRSIKSGSILSSNKNELWVSILEKSYHKFRGGYDSYGSNSVNLEIKKQTGNKLLCLLFLAHRNSSNHILDSGIFWNKEYSFICCRKNFRSLQWWKLPTFTWNWNEKRT